MRNKKRNRRKPYDVKFKVRDHFRIKVEDYNNPCVNMFVRYMKGEDDAGK